jgi:hypothetical protein
MKSRIASVLVVAAALLAGVSHAWSKDTKQTVKLDREAQVGESVLVAGTYGVELSPGRDTARFLAKGRLVAEVPSRVELADVVYPGIAVHFHTGGPGPDRLVKIVVASSNLAIEFPRDLGEAVDRPVASTVERP